LRIFYPVVKKEQLGMCPG